MNNGDIKEKNMPTDKSEELYKALKAKGYKDELCAEIAYRQLTTDYTATRMLGYLYRVSEPREEDMIDEMISILSDRKSFIEKHEANEANAAISRMYRDGLL